MTSSARVTLAQVRSFLAGTTELTLTCAAEDAARYQFIAAVAQRFNLLAPAAHPSAAALA